MARRRKRAHLAAVAPSMEPLRRPVYRRVRRRPDAAELAQEVYVRILRLPDLATIRDPGAYLYTVASNLARDHARRERHGPAMASRSSASSSPGRGASVRGCARTRLYA